MKYYLIQKVNRENTVVGMSHMKTPTGGMIVPCSLRVGVTKVGDKHRVVISRNKNKVFPVDWEDIYILREISKVEFENYSEMRLFPILKEEWFDRFLQRFRRSRTNFK